MTTIHVTNTHYYHNFFVFSYTMLGMDHQRFPLIGIVIPLFVLFSNFLFLFLSCGVMVFLSPLY